MSHYFEITGLLNNEEYYPHGIDVGFSSVVTAKLRQKLINKTPVKQAFDENNWEKEINRIYKSSAEGVLALQKKLGWYNEDSSVIMSNSDVISDILSEAPNADEFTKMLESVELYYDDFCKFYGEKKIKDAVLYAKDLKDRYSVLWLNVKYFNETV